MSNVGMSQTTVTSALTGDGPDRGSAWSWSTMMWNRSSPLVRRQLGVGSSPPQIGQVRFSPEAKDALRSAHRFALGEPATEHMLILIVRRSESGACDILRALGADPHRIRFEIKKRAWPSSFARPGAPPRGELRLVGTVSLESLGKLDFAD
jgi:hypothetical protein